MAEPSGGGFVALIPMLVMGVFLAFVVHTLAKQKGLEPWKWTILALIPVVNFYIALYVVGVPNLNLERKVDKLLEKYG